MYLPTKLSIKLAVLILISNLLIASHAYAPSQKTDELDSLRSSLFNSNSASPEYKKNLVKLNKVIAANKINYSQKERLEDTKRLIKEYKYDAAKFELNNLIQEKYSLSKCNEYLGDIATKQKDTSSKIANYYKEALKYDNNNISANYKLARLYFKENKNISGIQYLKKTVEITDNMELLNDISNLILTSVTPIDRFEANNLYEILGMVYEKINLPLKSFDAYKKAIQLNEEDIFLKYHLADLYLLNNRKSDALILYDSILSENNDSQIRALKAEVAKMDGDYTTAVEEYLAILNTYPASAYAKYSLYSIYVNQSPEKILKIINSNKNRYSPSKEDALYFAQFLYNIGDENGYIKFMQYAKSFDKKEEPVIEKEIEVTPVKRNVQNKLKQTAQKQKPKQNKIAPIKEQKKNINLKNIKQTEINKTSQDKKESINLSGSDKAIDAKKQTSEQKTVKKSIQNTKKPVQVAKKSATVAKQNKNTAQVSKATQKKPEIKKASKVAKLENKPIKDVSKYNDYKKALIKYQKTNPKDKNTYVAIANTYKLMGENVNALENYNKALKIDPIDSNLYFDIGLLYLESNMLTNAKNNFTKSLNLNSEDTKSRNMLAFVDQKIITQYINQSYEEFEENNYLVAEEILNNGIKQYPNNAQMYYYRALIYDAMKRNGAQVIDLQKAIELDPGYYMAYYQLGVAYEKIKNERSALVSYEKFLSIEPDEKDLVKEVQQKIQILGNKYY